MRNYPLPRKAVLFQRSLPVILRGSPSWLPIGNLMKSLILAVPLLLALLATADVQGQQAVDAETIPVLASRKRVDLLRTELEPEIDGVLDDPIWREATVIEDLHQFQPVDQGVPSEKSVFYIAYSERYLYVAARLYDSDPSGIVARQLVQGGDFRSDDSFEFILDTFNTGRTGYHFLVNPNGIRREGVYENPNQLNEDWTGIWQVEARIDDEGWTAEVAIPFNTLNFDPATEDWGFTLGRYIARKREELAWSSYNRTINPTTTGLLRGIRDIRQGRGIDIIPSVTVAGNEDYIRDVSGQRFDPSLNMFYKITPNLTGALTLNTDFSATEVDNRQVNLSRFSLFFPEKRDFFLQDVDIFSFGGLSQNGIPFYSRRIGISLTGQPVDIDSGVKLTGRVGDWNVGGLVVQQGDQPGLDGQAVFVGRATANVLGESNIGVIFTQGDPNRERDNSVAGVDFRYQNTRFSSTHTMRGNVWVQKSDTEGLQGDDTAFGIQGSLDTQSNGFGVFGNYNQFGREFNPAMGFANNTGIRSVNLGGNARYFLRDNDLFRNMFSFMNFTYNEDMATGRMQTQDFFWRAINLNTHYGGAIGGGMYSGKEGLDFPFAIRPGIIIPAGVYSYSGVNAEFRLSEQRALAPRLTLSKGDFYNGDREQYNLGLQWRPGQHLFMGFDYSYQDVSLPAGDFIVRLVRMNANYAFNSKWSWINLLQYDNGSRQLGLNSRLRWNPQAGEDLYIVINYNFDSSEGAFTGMSAQSAELVLKYTKTLRF
jgi:hypothetical protein